MLEFLKEITLRVMGMTDFMKFWTLLGSHTVVAILFFVLGMTLGKPDIHVYTKEQLRDLQDNKPSVWRSIEDEALQSLPSSSGDSPAL